MEPQVEQVAIGETDEEEENLTRMVRICKWA